MRILGRTDIGLKRKNNEDTFFISESPVGIFDAFMIVADGMGGYSYGEVASGRCVDTIVNYIRTAPVDFPQMLLRRAIEAANTRVRKEAHSLMSYGMGTTCVAAGLINGHIYAANIGDSRLYLINANDFSMKQITKDHSFVEEQVANGMMTRGSEEYESQKNVITRAVGIYERVEPDLFDFDLNDGDYLLLCSDGLTNMVNDVVIKNLILDDSFTLERRLDSLIDNANKNGGKDNITVVLLEKDEVM
ncbi:MAG: Stp1/IreP family PP2C-type Ser/Thr phosphatase [Lachnospiraceae bacterium]|nr:Stp1/IreP family PP2C-type Ser/Thr phosphatase [Lachnospiraceae bacterium]